MTAAQAIRQSVSTRDVVSLSFDESTLDALLHETHDYVRGVNNWQFWGEHEGQEWRVLMFFPGAI